MRITGIETFCLRYDMPYALTYARGEYSTREALLVKVTTDDPSIFGWGESAMWGGPHGVTAAVIEKEIYPLLAGQDPRRPEYLWEKVFQETYYHGRRICRGCPTARCRYPRAQRSGCRAGHDSRSPGRPSPTDIQAGAGPGRRSGE